MKQPDENILKCPACFVPIVCDDGLVPKHGKRVDGVAMWLCDGVGLKGEKIKEKKSK